ncbi:hypothetical protein [Clostridium estertheticum]|uniref:hypothetical protein n=1 Tax=Clostridium estertheticum TaxID=238834 RepID=UPI001C7D5ABD|nr:hypothetical protein [Clostridium estertheticum]MBX4263751.1 hypothetical protein [Clostridium estertheticum]WLC87565.1 hypothetical protein KTC95_15720 [Clostridium estertheticum]
MNSGNLSEDAKLTYTDIGGLIQVAGEFLNYYYGILSGKYYSIEALNSDDVNKVLSILRHHNESVASFINNRKLL